LTGPAEAVSAPPQHADLEAVVGGPGDDTVSFADAAHEIVANLGPGSATGDGPDVIAGVERMLGSPLGDRLIGNDPPTS